MYDNYVFRSPIVRVQLCNTERCVSPKIFWQLCRLKAPHHIRILFNETVVGNILACVCRTVFCSFLPCHGTIPLSPFFFKCIVQIKKPNNPPKKKEVFMTCFGIFNKILHSFLVLGFKNSDIWNCSDISNWCQIRGSFVVSSSLEALVRKV